MAGTTSTRTAEVPVQRPAAPGAAPLDEEVVQILLVDDQPPPRGSPGLARGTGCQFVSARSADEALLALLDQDLRRDRSGRADAGHDGPESRRSSSSASDLACPHLFLTRT